MTSNMRRYIINAMIQSFKKEVSAYRISNPCWWEGENHSSIQSITRLDRRNSSEILKKRVFFPIKIRSLIKIKNYFPIIYESNQLLYSQNLIFRKISDSVSWKFRKSFFFLLITKFDIFYRKIFPIFSFLKNCLIKNLGTFKT